ncbi:hypothetical protein E1293_22495 [Actinomadura darangshiensis]|uniref:Deoxyribonuclease NucA/NucB domain-containing protein n=1 Tax=Actinomadura darangshiensis TaxID=705336 RepID=A0A4R5B4K6_9ACTN|nr:hypothetical protein [Actinomadura darangshiensis]TDD79729.1 hypothetical protein E1293_22495 [Actinomadura darangshiensis]
MKRFPVVVAAVVSVLSLTLTAFTPRPGHSSQQASSAPSAASSDPTVAHRDPSDPAAVKGYLERLQRGSVSKKPKCNNIRLKGKRARLCQDTVSPDKAPKAPAWSKLQRRASDPQPPALCSKVPGQVNYDRFHACQESTLRIVIQAEDGTTKVGYVRWDVWATLSPTNSTWLMQVGLTPTVLPPELVEAGPWETASVACNTGTCKIPDPVKKKIFPGVYTYYKLATAIPLTAPGEIKYTNPQIQLTISTDSAFPTVPTAPTNDPFNVRCDSEAYIGGEGCVYYMGTASAATCDEYPYASSEEGGTKNPRFSCAFLPGTDNTNHGNALNNALYRANRILPALNEGGTYIQGDPYWVWVLNAPADNQIPTVKQCSQY